MFCIVLATTAYNTTQHYGNMYGELETIELAQLKLFFLLSLNLFVVFF